MSIQLSELLLNNQLDQLRDTIGPAPSLRIYDGILPDECALPADGAMLVDMFLPTEWLQPAENAMVSKAGQWQGVALANGVATYFRIYDQADNCHLQGTITQTGSGGDMTLSTTTITTDEAVIIIGFSLNYIP